MNFELMAERTRYLKEKPKRIQAICKVMEDMRNESLKEVAKRRLANGMLTLKKTQNMLELLLKK